MTALIKIECWKYVGEKKNKVWLIYAYHRESGEIVAFIWGKRDLKTVRKLRKRIKRMGIRSDRIATAFFQPSRRTIMRWGKTYGRDREESLPDEASDQAGVSEDVLFFQKNCSTNGKRLTWLCLRRITLCGSPPDFQLFKGYVQS
ncbi:MAG: hypothetical protein LBO67_09465 [Spirochaetaceae bacterium]|jgi:IS1 family transposase|nr:hypothetical protein [Spirochaetaceae bacterium]